MTLQILSPSTKSGSKNQSQRWITYIHYNEDSPKSPALPQVISSGWVGHRWKTGRAGARGLRRVCEALLWGLCIKKTILAYLCCRLPEFCNLLIVTEIPIFLILHFSYRSLYAGVCEPEHSAMFCNLSLKAAVRKVTIFLPSLDNDLIPLHPLTASLHVFTGNMPESVTRVSSGTPGSCWAPFHGVLWGWRVVVLNKREAAFRHEHVPWPLAASRADAAGPLPYMGKPLNSLAAGISGRDVTAHNSPRIGIQKFHFLVGGISTSALVPRKRGKRHRRALVWRFKPPRDRRRCLDRA